MNKNRILTIASDVLAGRAYGPEKVTFNMREFLVHGDCGTTACIAGFVVLRYGSDIEQAILRCGPIKNNVVRIAGDILGLEFDTAADLFLGRPDGSLWGEITPEIAHRVLMKLARTGDVDWDTQIGVAQTCIYAISVTNSVASKGGIS